MQAAAAPVLPVASTWANPGPFILLLFLPALPLLLFSIGARPPDTHSLPFSTDDIWQTTAFVTIAGAVALCVGIYPGMLADMGAWVRNGAGDSPYWAGLINPSKRMSLSGDRGDDVPSRDAQFDATRKIRARYEPGVKQPPRVETRPEAYRRDSRHVYYRPPSRQLVPGTQSGGRFVVETVDASVQARVQSPSAEHVAALRDSSIYYSPSKPPLVMGLLAGGLLIVLVIILTGQILRSAYDTEKSPAEKPSKSKSPEPWHLRELQKRSKETEAETIERNKKEEGEFSRRLGRLDIKARAKEVERRQKDLDALKEELKKRKMPVVGVDWNLDGKEPTKTPTATAADKAKPSNRLKNILLGPLSRPSGTPSSKPSDVSGGAGWKPADDAVAHAAIRGGAARAEDMANRLVKEKPDAVVT